jgi:hypothetical protein
MNQILAESGLITLAHRLDPDLLGAMGIVSVVGFFVTSIVMIVTVGRTVQNLTLARMQVKLIYELLAQGHSVNDVQQLVQGKRKNVFSRFFDSRRQSYVHSRPMPPVKTNV